MRKLLVIFIAFGFTSGVTERQYNFKFTEKEATQIIQSVQSSELISAKDASIIVAKMQQQASDSILNPKSK